MTEILYASSNELARRFDLPVREDEPGILLERVGGVLRFRDLREAAPGPLYADFQTDDIKRRRKAGRRLPLARAVGVRAGEIPIRVLDATAGLCRDAWTLAALGCDVTAIERSPVIAAVARDALARANGRTAERVRLIVGDAAELMHGLAGDDRPDVVYLDPMFPPRSKSAQVKKEMQYFRALFGEDDDGARLFAPAMRCARSRVVVKRPAKGAPMVESPKVNHTIEGKTVRFDVYLAPIDTP